MALPNFFILGAMKAGTTSLWHYLGQHPEVFVSEIKEPNYFVVQNGFLPKTVDWDVIPPQPITTTLEDYEALFSRSEGFKAVGEASHTYMFYEHAVPAINKIVPEARMICILRNPCDRAFSHYNFLRLVGVEPTSDFMEAVAIDAARPADRRISYVEKGLYYQQLVRLYLTCDPSRVKVIFFEDLKTSSQKVLGAVFEFLKIDSTVQINTAARLSVSGIPRSHLLHKLLGCPNPIKSALLPILPAPLKNLARAAKNLNLQKQHLTPDERIVLLGRFLEDIERVETLLKINLDCWRGGH